MEKFSNIKIFTILISCFYILALYSAFSNFSIVSSVILFFLLSILVLFFKFDYKKVIFLYFIFILGLLRVELLNSIENILSQTDAYEIKVTGKILTSKDVQNDKKRVKFYLLINKMNSEFETLNNLKSKVLVSLNYDNLDKEILIGDTIEVKGKIRTPKSATNPYQFDYKKYLFNNDCAEILYGELADYKKLSSPKLKTDPWYFILQKFELTRNNIIKTHAKIIKSPELEILGGIVFGNETINPDEKIKENFKNSGLLHLLAASGLNVALIFGIWWWIAQLIRFPYNLSILLGALFVIFYTFMTGFPPSIIRASIMLLFVLFGKLIDRNVNSISLIFFAAFLILLFEPKMLFDVGFQLSFLVAFGLIVMCPIVIEKLSEKDKKYIEKYKNEFELKKQFLYLFKPTNLVSVVLVPLTAQLWVIPLQMHYFNNIAPFSVIANIAVVPFIALLSFIGFIGSIFALIPTINGFIVFVFDKIANPFLILLVKISEIFASFKYSLLNVESLNCFQMFSFWFILLILALNIKTSFKNKKHICILVSLSIIFLLSFIQINPKTLDIVMFDVENADCFLVKTPKNRYILIDTGKKPYHGFSSFDTVTKKYFLNKRIKKLDLLILTHFDMDHAGSAIDILKTIKCDKIIIQKESYKTFLSTEILNYLKENKLNYKIAKNNETVYFEKDLSLKTLVPNGDRESDNETSIATLLTYKDKKALFMADIGVLGYNSLEKYIPSNIDILKIGHHGAKGVVDNKMLDKLNPKYALISAGSNRFNHPNFETINLLEKKNIKILSTKTQGFSKITIDKEIKPYTFKN